jgi:hypothetical protein
MSHFSNFFCKSMTKCHYLLFLLPTTNLLVLTLFDIDPPRCLVVKSSEESSVVFEGVEYLSRI